MTLTLIFWLLNYTPSLPAFDLFECVVVAGIDPSTDTECEAGAMANWLAVKYGLPEPYKWMR